MGYMTEFSGSFKITPTLSAKDKEFLEKFNSTRRMARNIEGYGVEGEFYVDGAGEYGQDRDSTVIDYNRPPSTQPGLWCQWVPSEDGSELKWDEDEKFYSYVEWLEYLVNQILKPRGYAINGEVEWQGEDRDDRGMIVALNNEIATKTGKFIYD